MTASAPSWLKLKPGQPLLSFSILYTFTVPFNETLSMYVLLSKPYSNNGSLLIIQTRILLNLFQYEDAIEGMRGKGTA